MGVGWTSSSKIEFAFAGKEADSPYHNMLSLSNLTYLFLRAYIGRVRLRYSNSMSLFTIIIVQPILHQWRTCRLS
jgi:hypothetical protein